jgi:site-specific DNA-methyltransferase (adenine-specific)
MCVNVANLGRKPFRSLAGDVARILQDDLGLLLRGEVVWIKAKGAAGNCAWGSFQSPTNPSLRDVTERIVVAAKGRFDRAPKPAVRKERGLPWEATISREEFMALTLDTWEFPPASAKRTGHPAPFPVELPRRCIELYTFKGDVVLDPFMGAGATAEAAVRTDRRYLGFELDPRYVTLAETRLADLA